MYLKKCITHSSCKNLIYNKKTHLKNDNNTKNNVKMKKFMHFLMHPSMHLPK
jgi:hypothetical protein